ncbi:hypothetical protein EON62_05325 [archaeon]|nr:MAG: hypothetical protein EON62_05325 [archaeon]
MNVFSEIASNVNSREYAECRIARSGDTPAHVEEARFEVVAAMEWTAREGVRRALYPQAREHRPRGGHTKWSAAHSVC